MDEDAFGQLAELMADVILRDTDVRHPIMRLRRRFGELRFCFSGNEYDTLMRRMMELV